LSEKNLGRRIEIGRNKKKNGQPGAGPPVQAPVDQGQKEEVEPLVAEEREELERKVQLGAEGLQPEDEADAPIECWRQIFGHLCFFSSGNTSAL
jgi:hypothetical protein